MIQAIMLRFHTKCLGFIVFLGLARSVCRQEMAYFKPVTNCLDGWKEWRDGWTQGFLNTVSPRSHSALLPRRDHKGWVIPEHTCFLAACLSLNPGGEHQCWGVGLETMQSREQLDQPMLGCLGGYFNDHLTIYQILSWWFTFFKKKKKEKNFFLRFRKPTIHYFVNTQNAKRM